MGMEYSCCVMGIYPVCTDPTKHPLYHLLHALGCLRIHDDLAIAEAAIDKDTTLCSMMAAKLGDVLAKAS